MAKPRLTAVALTDIRSIKGYSRTAFDTKVALNYIEGLRDTFRLLGEHPRAGVRETDLGEAMRSFPYRSHPIFYRVDADAVLIVRVLHHAQDAASMLGGVQ